MPSESLPMCAWPSLTRSASCTAYFVFGHRRRGARGRGDTTRFAKSTQRSTTISRGCSAASCASDEQVFDHVAKHVRQPEISTSVTIRELGVIDPELMQQCGVQVVDRDAAVDRLEAEFVRRT